jgi:hypothetical protein
VSCTRDEQSSDFVITSVAGNLECNGDSDQKQTAHRLVKNAHTWFYVGKGGRKIEEG